MLVKEIVYSILDLCKLSGSDDTFINEDHVLFLCKKYRALLIKKDQEKNKGVTDTAAEFEQQEICLNLEKVPAIDGTPCTGGYYLRTKEVIPKVLEGYQPRIYPIDYYQGTYITFISRDRMRYVGSNCHLKNIIYASLGPNLHLYLTSGNSQFFHMKQLRMSAVFEDFDAVVKLLCDGTGVCDVMDMTFPIREHLVPLLIDAVVKEIMGLKYQPTDNINNATDDNSEIQTQK